MQLLGVKSELIERESQIEQLMNTLSKKGEEAGQLAERLVELKNHMLDQVVFEEQYHVKRIVDVGDKKKYPSFDMVICFVRDPSRYGELFLQISVP